MKKILPISLLGILVVLIGCTSEGKVMEYTFLNTMTKVSYGCDGEVEHENKAVGSITRICNGNLTEASCYSIVRDEESTANSYFSDSFGGLVHEEEIGCEDARIDHPEAFIN
jgi:hypothetical protein